MNVTQGQVKALLARGEVRISEHGYDELAEDSIFARDVVAGFTNAELLEDYPDFPKGSNGPAVVVTAYRPDPDRWSDDFRRRK